MKIKNFLIRNGLHRVSRSVSAIKIKVIKLHLQEITKERRMRVFSFDVIEYITKINYKFYHCIQKKIVFNAKWHLDNLSSKRRKMFNIR